MSPEPTGSFLTVDGAPVLVLERTVPAPIADVWASLTESDRLGQWIGTYSGDPESGSVTFLMTAEESATAETMQIRACEAPRSLKVTSLSDYGTWQLDVELTEADGSTTMTLRQPALSASEAESVGPGWEYYLDRWVAALDGRDVSLISFADYAPAMQEHYQRAWPATPESV